MFTFGIIALLGTAQAETPKKKTEKTEESKTEKSGKSTSKKPAASKSKPVSKKPASKNGSSKKVTKKPAPKKPVQKSPTSSPKRTTQHSPPNPTGKAKTTGSPAKQRTGQEQTHGTAHSPIGNSSSSHTNRPSYNRAPNNVERPTVGQEQRNTPNAHTPIGNKEGHRTPTYDRAPDNVKRPGVGKERDNAPTAHQPIGSGTTTNRPEKNGPTREPEGRIDRQPPRKDSTRPEKNRPSREPEGRIDREPPTRKESNRPDKNRPTRDADRPTNERIERHPPSKKESTRPEKNRPSKVEQTANPRVDRSKPDPQRCNDCPTQSVSTGKSQNRNAYNGGFNTSTRRTNATQDRGGSSSSPFGFGLGTLSYSSDYVDGGAYNDGGLGLSLGVRVISQFEIEASYGRYTDSTLEASRNRLNRPLQLVGQVHPFPEAVVSPFVSGGYVWNHIDVDDTYLADGEYKTAQQEDWLTGLALGAGVTFNVHQNVALELDGRLFQYNNLEYWDDVGDTATLVSMGVVVGF